MQTLRNCSMKFRDARKMLEANGFELLRRADGSHTIFQNEKGVRIILPEHHNKDIPPFIVKQICKIMQGVV